MTEPKPRVEYDGKSYALRSAKTEIPDLESVSRMAALVWLNKNTVAKGTNHRRPEPNLRGYLAGGGSLK